MDRELPPVDGALIIPRQSASSLPAQPWDESLSRRDPAPPPFPSMKKAARRRYKGWESWLDFRRWAVAVSNETDGSVCVSYDVRAKIGARKREEEQQHGDPECCPAEPIAPGEHEPRCRRHRRRRHVPPVAATAAGRNRRARHVARFTARSPRLPVPGRRLHHRHGLALPTPWRSPRRHSGAAGRASAPGSASRSARSTGCGSRRSRR